jgi:hypothetical protein
MGWNPFAKRGKAVEKARAKAAMPPIPPPDELAKESPPADPGSRVDRLDEAMVLAAIDEARRELEDRERAARRRARVPDAARSASKQPSGGDPNASKTELIHAAMTVHRLKQSALNDLNPEQRERLRGMAESMLGVGNNKKK